MYELIKQRFPTFREGYKCQAREHLRPGRDWEICQGTQGAGCAAGEFPSGLGWEVRLGCLCVV